MKEQPYEATALRFLAWTQLTVVALWAFYYLFSGSRYGHDEATQVPIRLLWSSIAVLTAMTGTAALLALATVAEEISALRVHLAPRPESSLPPDLPS